MSASRYSYLGGVSGTSNVKAAQAFDIPCKGTHAHAYVTSFNGFDELPSPNLQLSYASKIGLGEDSIDSIVIKNINEEQWFVSWEMGNHALFSYSSWNFCLKAFFLRYGIEWLLSDFSTDKLSI